MYLAFEDIVYLFMHLRANVIQLCKRTCNEAIRPFMFMGLYFESLVVSSYYVGTIMEMACHNGVKTHNRCGTPMPS